MNCRGDTYDGSMMVNMSAQDVMVSICCLTYKHEEYVREALDGFLSQQTDFDYEILIHDDASTDCTRDIIEEYCMQYPEKIFPVYQEVNQYSLLGPGMNPRFNFARARGKYLAICEGDDYWIDKNKLQKQVDFLEANNEYNICFHNVKVIYENSTKSTHLFHENSLKQEFTLADIVKGNFINTCSVMYRNISSNVPDYISKSSAGDWILNVHFATDGRIGYLDDVMSVYRIHDGGVFQHHKNWSFERHIHHRNLVLVSRYEMLKQFDNDQNIIRIIKRKINADYMEILVLSMFCDRRNLLFHLSNFVFRHFNFMNFLRIPINIYRVIFNGKFQ